MKVPKARKLSSGNWFIQLKLGGESISVTTKTEKECIAAAQLIKAEYLAGKRNKPAGSDITLRQAIDKYINAKDNILSPATVRGYDGIRNNRFKDHMGKPISSVGWQAACNEEATLCSAKTLKNAWGLVSPALKYSKINVPDITLPQVVEKEHPWLEPEQLDIFMEAIKGDICETQALIAAHGLRLSEILSIDLSKIDLGKNTIRVSGSTVRDRNSKLVDKETNKNKTSNRFVPIMIPRLKELLKDAKDSDTAIINCHFNTLFRHINKVCVSCGLPPVGIHGLRHSFASLCNHVGLSERETMDLGGWADANTMRKIYIHLARRDKLNAVSKLTEYFSNADNKEYEPSESDTNNADIYDISFMIPKARRLESGNWNIQLRLDGNSISITAKSQGECEKQARYIKAMHLADKQKLAASN